MKKGFTMVELMVSIAIIAIVMVFLVRLLVDVKYDFTNELYNTSNQINRAEIIKTIQEDWLGKKLVDINDEKNNDDIELKGDNNITATISFSKDDDENEYIHYTSTEAKKYKWKIEKNNKETFIKTKNIEVRVIKGQNMNNIEPDSKDYLVEIDIPIIIDNSKLRIENDSRMDNIILTFYNYGGNSFSSDIILNATE